MSVLSGDSPKRIQLSRRKGYRKPEGAIVVARPSKWGNPYRVNKRDGRDGYRDAKATFKFDLTSCIASPFTAEHPIEIRIIAESIGELRGKDLACWCPVGFPCHADVLLELANS